MMVNQQAKRRIGILGGMGPEATVYLMARVIAMTSADDDNDHVPMIVDSNTQVPSRIRALIDKTGEDPSPVLVDMARRLEANGAEALAMPCNTAHHYAQVIKAAVNIPFLNMVELATARVDAMAPANRRVGLLASPAVQSTQIFDQAFSSCQIKTLYPANQNRMLDAIRLIKIDSNDVSARQTVKEAARELMDNGAGCLLVACSELSIIADAIPPAIPRLDTIDILAAAIIEFSGTDLCNENTGGALGQMCA